ncbi:hypothetical protein EsDP_00006133 [Epichloe bromicola]|uniref:AA1-like domain-containing protein n=1 Tax=Epichloe bromicola TaxID=79588 RepID=A0ABQ0CWP8_9HYPO
MTSGENVWGLSPALLSPHNFGPAGRENIKISDFSLHKDIDANNKITINELSFRLSDKHATGLLCSVNDPVYNPEPTDWTKCGGNSTYYFQLLPGIDDSDYGLYILQNNTCVSTASPPHLLVTIPIRQHADAIFSFRSSY